MGGDAEVGGEGSSGWWTDRDAGGCGTNIMKREVNYREDPTLQMRESTRLLLQAFSAPFNALLSELMGRDPVVALINLL